MEITSEKVSFPGAGGVLLAARFDRPVGPVKATALFAHCFTCSKDGHAATRIARALAGLGIATLRFDFTGLGGSDGDFANSGFSSNVGDLVAAADFLRSRGEAPRILIGHSLGGAAVLAAAARVPEAKAVATIGAPADPDHVRHLLADAAPEIEAKGAPKSRSPGGTSGSPRASSTTSAVIRWVRRSGSCIVRCSSSMRRPTTPSASTMRPGSSSPPAIRRASSRLPARITC